jgi:hypothetical protein
MRRQAKRTLVVLIAIIALIASQFWVSAYACANTSNATTVSSTAVISVAPAWLNGHDDLHDQHTANLCQAHCDNTAQPDHSPQSVPSPTVWLPQIWGLPSVQTCAVQASVPGHTESPLTAAFPPPRILFQVFRT